MSLKQTIEEDMKQALKAGEKDKVSALRMLLAEVKNAEIRKKEELKKDEILEVIISQAKKWEEAAAEYKKVNDEERAAKERQDAAFLKNYLPEQLADEELKSLIEQTIGEVGASEMKDMGKVMQAVMPKVKGRADGKKVNETVKLMLSQEGQD